MGKAIIRGRIVNAYPPPNPKTPIAFLPDGWDGDALLWVSREDVESVEPDRVGMACNCIVGQCEAEHAGEPRCRLADTPANATMQAAFSDDTDSYRAAYRREYGLEDRAAPADGEPWSAYEAVRDTLAAAGPSGSVVRPVIEAMYGLAGEDDDPRCVCGTARSEHALCGCEQFERAKVQPAEESTPFVNWHFPRWAVNTTREMSQVQHHVLLVLAEHMALHGAEASIGVERIATICRMSERTVQRALKALVESGAIIPASSNAGGRGNTSSYRLVMKDASASN